MPKLEEGNKERVRQWFDTLSRGDVEALLQGYAEDAEIWTAGSTLISGSRSKEQARKDAGSILEVFPQGLRFEIKAMTAEGERVAVEAESHGLHASGEIYHNQYHFLFVFRDGLLVQLREYMDTELVTQVLCGGQRPHSGA